MSLYTSIPHNLGLQAIASWIDKSKDLITERFHRDFILDSTKFMLENNNFMLDTIMYHKTKGTAMGTKFAPRYACLSIGFLEKKKLFTQILPKYINSISCKYIESNLQTM